MGVPCMYILVILTTLLMVISFLMIVFISSTYRRLRLEGNKVRIRIRISLRVRSSLEV